MKWGRRQLAVGTGGGGRVREKKSPVPVACVERVLVPPATGERLVT